MIGGVSRNDERRVRGGGRRWNRDERRHSGGIGWTGLPKEGVPGEAAIALAAVRVEDPEVCAPPRRPEMVPGDNHLRPLPDDVTAQPNPRPTDQFQPEPDRLTQRARDALGQARWLEHDEQAARSTSERGEPMEAIRHSGRPFAGCAGLFRTGVLRPQNNGQVNEEEVHRPTLQQGAGDVETLVQRFRRQDDEPLQPNATRDSLDGIEGAG